jgi:hypothetical protein
MTLSVAHVWVFRACPKRALNIGPGRCHSCVHSFSRSCERREGGVEWKVSADGHGGICGHSLNRDRDFTLLAVVALAPGHRLGRGDFQRSAVECPANRSGDIGRSRRCCAISWPVCPRRSSSTCHSRGTLPLPFEKNRTSRWFPTRCPQVHAKSFVFNIMLLAMSSLPKVSLAFADNFFDANEPERTTR